MLTELKIHLQLKLFIWKKYIKNKAKTRWYYNCLPKRVVRAFTLAEVLITLLIMGIIASLVIPALIADTQEKELIVAKKKAYGIATQAYMNAVRDNSGGFGDYGCGHHTKIPAIMSQLNVIKTCNGNTFGNCWAQNGVTPYGSGGCSWGFSKDGQNSDTAYVTADGMYWLHYQNCDTVAIDVNGAKGPNQWNKDVFDIGMFDTTIRIGTCSPSNVSFLTN